MPRRNHKRTARRRPTGDDPVEKTPTLDQLAFRLVLAGRASPRILGELHPCVDISRLFNNDTPQREDAR